MPAQVPWFRVGEDAHLGDPVIFLRESAVPGVGQELEAMHLNLALLEACVAQLEARTLPARWHQFCAWVRRLFS